MRVRHRFAEAGALSADVADGGHDETPQIFGPTTGLRVTRRLGQDNRRRGDAPKRPTPGDTV
ncbi:hypothetical protein I552_4825 [Mycobacterium xenopi 3993]|nr:hypothetical protein I552_4825 [Mycobacterium xenopi 3993]